MIFEKITIGDATLIRGDSIALLEQGYYQQFELGAIVSDPPYGIGYEYGGGGNGCRHFSGYTAAAIKNVKEQIKGDDQPFQPQAWCDLAPLSGDKLGLKICLFGANNFMQRLPDGGTLLAWDKHLGSGADDSFTDCEWAWVGRKAKREVFRWKWKGVIKNQTQPLDFPFGKTIRSHVMQKPVELMRWCIEKCKAKEHSIILDPFMGSGSTGIAALSLGHQFVGVEFSQEHFDTAVKRVKAFYGLLEGSNMDMFNDYSGHKEEAA